MKTASLVGLGFTLFVVFTGCPGPMTSLDAGAGGGTATGGGTSATGGGTSTGGGTATGGGGGATSSSIARISGEYAVRPNGEVLNVARGESLFDGDRTRDFQANIGFIVIYSDGGVGYDAQGNDTSGLNGATKVQAGLSHACAVLPGGAVKCVGKLVSNLSGELGNGNTMTSTTVVDTGVTGATELMLGNARSCALKSDGTVMCWGREPGNGTSESSVPVEVTGLTGVQSLGGSWNATCAFASGRTSCWGDYYHLPVERDGGSFNLTPTDIESLAGAAEMHGGRDHDCARFTNGTVKCWGMHGVSYSYQLGVEMPRESTEPLLVPGIDDAVQLAVTQDATCVLRRTGVVTCWGYGYSRADAILRDMPALP